MKVLVINSGSSSIKYQLFSMPSQKVICSGMVERIGLKNGEIHFKSPDKKIYKKTEITTHKEGLRKIVDLLLDKKNGVINSTDQIKAVGHRVVHGGASFTKTTIIDENVKNKINELSCLAPLHNPHNLEGIEISEKFFSKAKQIAVFDTAFHQTMPEKAYKYAIPNYFLDKHKIRSYGFHGTSHKFVSEKANKYLDCVNSKLITIHLGNGCSITAIKNGKSIEHSLGFGPVTGLIMGTRSGDIDHVLIQYLVDKLGYTFNQVNTILQRESGMLGLTGYSDLRDIEFNAEKGDELCKLALDMNSYRIKKYIGSYVAAMNGIDAIVFTAGIGENSSLMRKLVCSNMDFYGIDLDLEKNKIKAKKIIEINKEKSKVKILIIPTNEELEIAKQTFDIL